VVAALIVGLVLGLGACPTAFAHGEETLELGAERVQPGGSVEVRGDLGAGQRFAVSLISRIDGSRRAIATIAATEEGHFDAYVTVPPDLRAGDYVLEVTAQEVADPAAARAPIAIVGSPVESEGERPDQAEGLLGPAASGITVGEPAAAGARPSRSASVTQPTDSAAAQEPLSGLALAGGVVGILALVALGGAIVRRARTDRS
jgi:hypothetical protein